MLVRTYPFLDPRRISHAISTSLQSLADDCGRLERDVSFVTDRLRTAPFLDQYAPVVSPLGLQLVGRVSDHPLLGSRMITTSQLWFADPENRWVRTLSRFYRLGRLRSNGNDLPTVSKYELDDENDGWPRDFL